MRNLTVALTLVLARCCCRRTTCCPHVSPSAALAHPPTPLPNPKSAPCADLHEEVILGINRGLADGDEIHVLGVRGDRAPLVEGGRYCVWGRYTLHSAPNATLRIASKRIKASGKVLEDNEDVEQFGRADVTGSGEFMFRFQATKEILNFALEFYSSEGEKRLGWIELGNVGC